MKRILESALLLCGAFSFLVTLLFCPAAVSLYISPEEPATLTLFPIIMSIVIMSAGSFLFILLNRLVSRFCRPFATLSSTAFPALAFILLLAAHFLASTEAAVQFRFLPLVVIVCLGLATSSQIYCFTRDSVLDSQGLFLSSGFAIIIGTFVSFLAFSPLFSPVFGVMLVALIMTVAGVFTAVHSKRSSHLDESEPMLKKRMNSTGADPKHAQSFSEAVLLSLPLVLISLFSTMAMGFGWQEEPFAWLHSNQYVLILTVLIILIYLLVMYHNWRKSRDIDVMLMGLSLPLALPVLISFFFYLMPFEWIITMTLLSNLLFLLYVWVGALLIGRIASRTESIASGFMAILLLCYACFMLFSHFSDPVTVSTITACAALCLFFYLLFYFFRKPRVHPQDESVSTREISKTLNMRCNEAAKQYGLSPRESELLPLLAIGFSAGAVGRRAFISPQTVKSHRYRIYQKIGVGSHEQLVEKLGLFDLDV